MDIIIVALQLRQFLLEKPVRFSWCFCVDIQVFNSHIFKSPGSGIAESYGITLNFLRNYQIVFHCCCTDSHFQQQCVCFNTFASLQTLASVCLFHDSHPSRYEIVPHSDFDFPLANAV